MLRVTQRNVRPFQTRPHPSPPVDVLIHQLNNWISSGDLYLGFGGMGDALLTLASCWNNPNSKFIFFANVGSIPLIEAFVKLINIPYFIRPNIMGTPTANLVHNMMKDTGRFKTSGHLADNLDCEDWRNDQKYKNRIVNRTPWIGRIGKIKSENKIIAIAPHGSQRIESRQRYLSSEELGTIVNKYLDRDYNVYCFGSEEQKSHFSLNRPNSYWVTDSMFYDHTNRKTRCDIKYMLQIINSAEEVISVDTWMKTYSLLVGLPTKVIMTRWSGHYKQYGEFITDFIFLNPNIWPEIKLLHFEDV